MRYVDAGVPDGTGWNSRRLVPLAVTGGTSPRGLRFSTGADHGGLAYVIWRTPLAHLRSKLLAAATLSLGLIACTPENPNAEATVTPAAETPAAETAGMPDDATKSFVEKAAISDMFEIEASKIVLERSKVQPVKDFAKMMIDMHTATTAELGPLATAASVTPPTALDNDHTAKLDELKNAKVEDFDDKYIDQQTDAHENALNLMKDFSANGKDAGLQAFATKTVPAVQAHLDHVKALDKSPADDMTKKPS
jgi:putative membrane protein